jgi:hypothetical protein
MQENRIPKMIRHKSHSQAQWQGRTARQETQ